MPTDFEGMLRRYADLTVTIGLNLQPGQRLLIIGPIANGGASLEAAPLVREITASAYRAGARLVETLWGDEAALAARPQYAPHDLVASLQQATAKSVRPFREYISRNQTNWAVVGAAASTWAARVFPGEEASQQVQRLWDAISRLCRLDRPDPIAAWEHHLSDL